MPAPATNNESLQPATQGGVFATTRWSIVLAARGDDKEGRAALETLCRTYWFPVYAMARRKGSDVEAARDFTQEFFARMLSREGFSAARREAGRFRAFVAQSVRNFLCDQWDRATALKRGGNYEMLSLDFDGAENRYRDIPDGESPDQIFDRKWAEEVLAGARERLSRELRTNDDSALADIMERSGSPSASTLEDDATRLGIPLNTLKSRMYRARQRYGTIIREIVAETTSNPLEVDAELRHLLAVMSP